ncbi:MAG: transcriptional repressor NrdR [Chloroflexia bacterium]|nr:transcriptional repressor NrdR [Chloroflexia bacterium]
MKCPYCRANSSRVVDTREMPTMDTIRRRRQCRECGRRFTTYERVEPISLMLVKRDGRREEYDRQKLESGIHLACTKRPISIETIQRIVDEIEAAIFSTASEEISSQAVGELVIEKLRQVDQVAYIRFASVYRSFADLEDIREELESLLGSET